MKILDVPVTAGAFDVEFPYSQGVQDLFLLSPTGDLESAVFTFLSYQIEGATPILVNNPNSGELLSLYQFTAQDNKDANTNISTHLVAPYLTIGSGNSNTTVTIRVAGTVGSGATGTYALHASDNKTSNSFTPDWYYRTDQIQGKTERTFFLAGDNIPVLMINMVNVASPSTLDITVEYLNGYVTTLRATEWIANQFRATSRLRGSATTTELLGLQNDYLCFSTVESNDFNPYISSVKSVRINNNEDPIIDCLKSNLLPDIFFRA